jgi:hypothetical protein
MPEDNPVKYRSIIKPVETRWNSQFFCLKSVFAMKQALLKLKFEPRDEKLANLIPSEQDFELLEALIPPLKELTTISKELSSDTKPTIHMVIPNLVNIGFLDKKYPLVPKEVTEFLQTVISELSKRIPDYGREEHLVFILPLYIYYLTVILPLYINYLTIILPF